MRIMNLATTDFSVIIECFLKAFANYYVPMPTDHNYYKKRWAIAGVRYDLSYGVFENDKLIAFMLHAVDEREGVQIAFNTGTGVLPNYRGQHLVQKLYAIALKDFKNIGVKKIKLEVIQENSKAIRAYQKVGFTIQKELLCYKGFLKPISSDKIVVKAVDIKNVDWQEIPNQLEYSWDFQKETLINSSYRFYYLLEENIYMGYFIIDVDNKMIAQFDLLVDDENQWQYLFAAMASFGKEFRLINLSAARIDKKNQLEIYGWENTINQYEMLYEF